MLYSRKIVLAIATCVVLASATDESVNAAQTAAKAAQKAVREAGQNTDTAPLKAAAKVAIAKHNLELTKRERTNNKVAERKAELAADVKVAGAVWVLEKANAKLVGETDATKKAAAEFVQKVAEKSHAVALAEQTVARVPAGDNSDNEAKAVKTAEANLAKAKLERDEHKFTTDAAAFTAEAATFDAELVTLNALKDGPVKKADIKVVEAKKKVALAKAKKANAELAKKADDITAATKELTDAETEKTKADADRLVAGDKEAELVEHGKRNFFQKIWHFVKTPSRRYQEAKTGKNTRDFRIFADDKLPGFFGTIKHMFWPTSASGYLTAAAAVSTLAAGGVGGTYLYNEHTKKKRASSRNTKWAIAAGLVTAAGAAAGGKYYYDNHYKAKQEGEYMGEDVDPDAETSQKADGSPNTKKPSSSKKNGKKSKKSGTHWMVWGAVIVVALAVIGGAVYYFLFMAEEGSEEDGDAVPEGMDQV